MMKKKYKANIILIAITIILLSQFNSFSASNTSSKINTTDKMGRPILDITNPTAERKPPEDALSDAERKTVKATSDGKYKDPTQNIISESTVEGSNIPAYEDYIKSLYDARMIQTLEQYGEITEIRYTVSITDVDKDRYILINDSVRDRLKMKVIVDSLGEHFAKDGFYKVNGKTYYFDEEEYMVLGPARDKKGNYYFFSYETGELIE